MNFEEEIQKTKAKIEEELMNFFKDKRGYQEKIFESMKYSLFSGGKRIRPILMLKSCQLFNEEYMKFIPFAIAIEMIHTYSLIHDDLPSMDDDDFRRGKLTNHKVFGEAMAILSGDGLLNLAFEIMADFAYNNSKTIEEYRRNIWAINEIGKYSGVFGMIGGQVVDLLSNDLCMDEDKLLYMYKCKTSALIQASVVSGAILGGATEKDIEKMRQFGLYLGLAYQIKDDILDVERDGSINKVTYLCFKSIEEAEKDVKLFSQKSIDILNSFVDKDVEFLKELTRRLIYREY
jgi:geranylgeranyl diphosphate synthase type II